MFTNEYKDSFGKIYTSGVYEKAQTTNKWSLAYTLLYALSKNGMKYATDTTGKCSVINNTSLGCKCQIVVAGTSATSGSLIITFKQICVKINVVTSADGKRAYPSGIFVTDLDGTTLATLCKYSDSATSGAIEVSSKTVIYADDYDPITNWSNNDDTDEDKYRVQTATFKDASSNFDIVSMHFWAEDIYLGAISVFKSKDYFSTKYKYGFGVYKALNAGTIYKFADNTSCELMSVFDGDIKFPAKIAKACLFVSDTYSGVVGGTNGLYRITDGTTNLSLLPENKVTINGREFQAVAPEIFARTS